MPKSSKSSGRWLREHFSDPYVKQAQKEGYRSRAVYKLMEINSRDKLFKAGMIIVDLGAAPGSWSQWLAEQVSPTGRVIAVDILPMSPLAGVEIIEGDFTETLILSQLQASLGQQKVDWVLSDMAPNLSGNASIDVPRALYLAELAFDFAKCQLKVGGGLLIKVFQGEGIDLLMHNIKAAFSSIVIRKPKASRGRSREFYIVARGFRKQ